MQAASLNQVECLIWKNVVIDRNNIVGNGNHIVHKQSVGIPSIIAIALRADNM
jgi:hypothetical protein